MQPSHLRVTLRVNSTDHALILEPRRTLLDALRNDLQLTGTKKGIVKLLGRILSPGNRRHFPDAIGTDPTFRRPALSL